MSEYNLIYGEDKFFIGAVKFFDTNKDFGFIASNNCNMDTHQYKQDFYVDSSSFVEDDAKKEGRVVVFQIHKQSNGKLKAIKVRRITKSDEDVQLALSYYGSHEFIEFKDNKKINLYTHTFKPVGLVAEHVKHLILGDPERSPEKTAQHFKFFVEHYKKEEYSKDKYIFDRHYSTEEKNIWVSLLSVFTDEECLEVLKIYPSIVRYINDRQILQRWIEAYISEDCSLSKLKEIFKNLEYLPEECVDIVRSRTEYIVDSRIKTLYSKLSLRSDFDERELTGAWHSIEYLSPNLYNKEVSTALDEIRSYSALTSRKYDDEIRQCVASVRENKFKRKLAAFKNEKLQSYSYTSFLDYLKILSKYEIRKYKEEIRNAISFKIEQNIDDNLLSDAVSLLNNVTILDEDFYTLYKKKLFPLIIELLSKRLRANINHLYRIKCDVLSPFEDLTSIYDKNEKEQIKQHIVTIFKETSSIYVISELASDRYQWLTISEALSLASSIVSSWKFQDLKKFLESEPDLFNANMQYVESIIGKAVQLVGNIPLKQFFDGSPVDDSQEAIYSRNPIRENCTFLNNLKRIIPEGGNCSEWYNYVSSRNAEELILLFENDVIESLPEEIITNLINSITLDFVYGDWRHWYENPSFKKPTYRKIFETTSADLVSLIGQRLYNMELSNENIPLAVFLAELMSANKPSIDDYNTSRNWESHFTKGLNELATNPSANKELTVVLWSVYFQTKSSMSTFSELFAFLPPYIQIRCVKKLFQLISLGKIKHTAESLYNLIGNGSKKICFPLEITLTYLKIRERDSNATLNNNVMLQLLEGRDDHMDWVGIRQMVTQCVGRHVARELPDDYTNRKRNSFFNGIIKKINTNTIRVFIPNKMVDDSGVEKNYNNKFFHSCIELIKLTYNEDEYKFTAIPQGVCFDFDLSYEVDLFSIARTYNFLYNGLNNYLEFEIKEELGDVFCECRQSNIVDNYFGVSFYWCGNKPCFRAPIRYHLPYEWEYYTILDFMRILNISADYTNKAGNITKYGHYIILSSYLKSFAKFYEHLSCRGCGKLMKPKGITNFTTRAVTEFSCDNEQCKEHGKTVYLNHCFNKKKCNATIDSRDSKKCPNEQYICPECGACCSTENFKLRIQHLHTTGGYISERLIQFVENDLGHWEKGIYFCYKCGKQMNKSRECPDCGVKYEK